MSEYKKMTVTLFCGLLGCVCFGVGDWLMLYGDTSYSGTISWLTIGAAEIAPWRNNLAMALAFPGIILYGVALFAIGELITGGKQKVYHYLTAFSLTPWLCLHLFYIMILYGFAWMSGNGYASAAIPISEAVFSHFSWLVLVSEVLMLPPYLYWGWLVLRKQSVLPQQMVLSNPLIFYLALKLITLLMPDSTFRLAFTNGLMSESMVLWFGSVLTWLCVYRNDLGLLCHSVCFGSREGIAIEQIQEEKQVSNFRTAVRNADGVLFPVSGRKDKVVITLSGSEGGLEHAEKLARYLQSEGIPAFALGYFGTKYSARYLSQVELENIEEAIRWLNAQGYEKIGIEGASKGAEYAAAAAIQFPELSMAILKTPSWFYSEGMTAGKRPSGTSCWSYQGRELPFTPYKTRRFPIVQEVLRNREYNILEFNTGKSINPDSIIPVEKIKAPILLFSTKADTIWPSAESGQKIVERLEEHDFPYPYRHICFEYMSHMMLENCGAAIKPFIKSERQFPEECAKERIIMGEECVRWIDQVWK